MAVSSLLVELFHNWLKFNDIGLGLIALGYVGLDWVLQIESIIVLLLWIVVLPIYLHNRKPVSVLSDFTMPATPTLLCYSNRV